MSGGFVEHREYLKRFSNKSNQVLLITSDACETLFLTLQRELVELLDIIQQLIPTTPCLA